MMRINTVAGIADYGFYPPVTPNNGNSSANDSGSTAQTGNGTTAAAIAAYDAAVSGTDDTMRNAPRNAALRQDLHDWDVGQTQAALNKAIEDELGGPTAISSTGALPGQGIIQRYSSDPVARPAVIAALLADPSVKNWINQTAQNIAAPYQGANPAVAIEDPKCAQQAAAKLQAAIAGLPPEVAAAVTQASLPTIQKVAQVQLPAGNDAFSTVQGVLSSIGDGPQAQSVIDQVASYYTKNFGAVNALAGHAGAPGVLAQTIESLATAPGGKVDLRFARSLADQLQRSSNKTMSDMAQPIRNAAADGEHSYLESDKSPLSAYNRAHDDAEEKTKRLSELLGQAGPLTPEQRQNFIKAYMSAPENADVFKNEAQAAKRLADYLSANRENLIYAAGQTPSSAKQLYDCMNDLTQSGQGTTSLSLIGSIDNDPAASKAFEKFDDYNGDFLDNTIASAQGQLLVEKDGDAQSAANALVELAEPVFKGANGWEKFKEYFPQTSKVGADPNVFTPQALSEAYGEMGKGKRGFAMASIMLSTYNGANANDVKAMMAAFGGAGFEADKLGAGALRYYADAGSLGRYTEDATRASETMSKFIPGVSIVASATGGWQDFKKAESDPVYGGAVAGDLISLIGGGLDVLPGGTLAGEAVTGFGMMVSAPFELLGGAIDGSKEASELKAQTKEYLKQMEELDVADGRKNQGRLDKTRMPDQIDGLDDTTIDALVASDPDQIKALTALNMTPTEIQTLGAAHPDLLQTSSKSEFLVELAKASGTQGAAVTGLADAFEQDDPSVAGIFTDRPSGAPLTSQDQDRLLNLVSHDYPNTKAYLQVADPTLVSHESDARRQADADFDSRLETPAPSFDQQIGYLLKHSGDAAYQAEIVNRLQQGQGLDRWVQAISQSGDGLPAAARNAIEAAANAGVFSPDKADRYLNALASS
jgi:hypothetical protein